MDKVGGYILLFKQMQDNWLWTDKPFARGQAWIDLLLMANFKDGTMVCKGTIVEIGRGQVFRTVKFLSERWGWSIKKTKNFLHLLESQEMVSLEGLPQGTRITIEKYNDYQLEGPSKGLSEVYTGDQPGTTEGLQKNKERIKKKKKEDIYTSEFEEVWDLYPKKHGKQDAKRHYINARKDGVTREEIESGIEAYKAYINATGTEDRYIKAGSSFFCQRAWENDWTVSKPKEKPKSNVYQPEPPKYPEFEPEPEVESSQMPDYVRARIGEIFG